MKKKPNEAKTALYVVGGIAAVLLIIAVVFLNNKPAPATSMPTTATGDAQEIRMGAANSEYSPAMFTVQSGKPVRWIIEGSNSMGCSKYLTAPQLGIHKTLNNGENVIEFTAPKPGTYAFSCSMNMARGTIKVV
jgi:plastocyanin domain-containing protein